MLALWYWHLDCAQLSGKYFRGIFLICFLLEKCILARFPFGCIIFLICKTQIVFTLGFSMSFGKCGCFELQLNWTFLKEFKENILLMWLISCETLWLWWDHVSGGKKPSCCDDFRGHLADNKSRRYCKCEISKLTCSYDDGYLLDWCTWRLSLLIKM